jgi:hypothetical protein
MIKDILKTKESKIILSIIWGIGLSCLFRKVCIERKCVVYSAPDPNTITKNVYLFDNKCYKYTTKNTLCNKNPIENNK